MKEITDYRLLFALVFVAAARTVETVSADFALRQTDGLDQRFEFVETQRSQSQAFTDGLNQLFVLWCACSGVFFEIFVRVALNFANELTGNQFHFALRRGEADERTAIDERRTGNADVYLACAVVEQHVHVVAQLRAAHNRVIAKRARVCR